MYIPVNKIIVNEQRLNEEKLDDFVEDIGRGRKMKPITVRVSGAHLDMGLTAYHIVDGHHRLAAYKILGKEMIEAVVTL
jgi:ParB-like chromosome segregation protein Spo0J